MQIYLVDFVWGLPLKNIIAQFRLYGISVMRLSLLVEALNLISLYMQLSSLSVANRHTSKMSVSGTMFVLS